MPDTTTIRARFAALLLGLRGAWLLVDGRAHPVPRELADRTLELLRLLRQAEGSA